MCADDTLGRCRLSLLLRSLAVVVGESGQKWIEITRSGHVHRQSTLCDRGNISLGGTSAPFSSLPSPKPPCLVCWPCLIGLLPLTEVTSVRREALDPAMGHSGVLPCARTALILHRSPSNCFTGFTARRWLRGIRLLVMP